MPTVFRKVLQEPVPASVRDVQWPRLAHACAGSLLVLPASRCSRGLWPQSQRRFQLVVPSREVRWIHARPQPLRVAAADHAQRADLCAAGTCLGSAFQFGPNPVPHQGCWLRLHRDGSPCRGTRMSRGGHILQRPLRQPGHEKAGDVGKVGAGDFLRSVDAICTHHWHHYLVFDDGYGAYSQRAYPSQDLRLRQVPTDMHWHHRLVHAAPRWPASAAHAGSPLAVPLLVDALQLLLQMFVFAGRV
mmetsp:Transcript_11520/g.30798  ORF Transcript_11520/g.30798 Transcript_11520/m.30798 type:complete len:245 (+) Transcript_11520:435-1169(+)